ACGTSPGCDGVSDEAARATPPAAIRARKTPTRFKERTVWTFSPCRPPHARAAPVSLLVCLWCRLPSGPPSRLLGLGVSVGELDLAAVIGTLAEQPEGGR